MIYLTTKDHPRSKPRSPWSAGVGGPWNLKNHWIFPKLGPNSYHWKKHDVKWPWNTAVPFIFTDPIYRVSEAGFKIQKFSRFSNLDNLTLEISAFYPAFDPSLETLIHLTSLTATQSKLKSNKYDDAISGYSEIIVMSSWRTVTAFHHIERVWI